MRGTERGWGVLGLALTLTLPGGIGPALQPVEAALQTPAPQPPPVEPRPPQATPRVSALVNELTQLALQRRPEGPERAEAAVKIAREEKDLVGETLVELRRAWCYFMIGRVPEALSALDITDQLAARVGDTAYQLHFRRVRWFFQRNEPGAEAAADDVIRLAERETHRPRAAARELEFLGSVVVEQRPAQALRVLEAGLRLYRKYPSETAQLADLLFQTARAHEGLGQWDRARAVATESLALRDRLTPRSPDAIDTLSLLANLTTHQHDLLGARAYLTRAVALAEEFRSNSDTLAHNLHGLAQIEMRLGNDRAAREHYPRAIELYRRTDPETESLAHALVEEANLLLRHGKHEEMRARLAEATPLYERQGTDTLSITVLNEAWGNYYLDRKDGVAAERYHRRTWELRERFVPGHHGIGTSVANTAEALLMQNRTDEAETLYGKAWEIALQYAREISDVHELEGFGSETDLTVSRYLHLLAVRGRARAALVLAEQSRGRSLRFMAADQRTVNRTLGAEARRQLEGLRSGYEMAEARLSQSGMELSRAEAAARRFGTETVPPFLADARKRHAEARTSFELARVASEVAWKDVTLATSAAGAIPDAATTEAALRRLPPGTLYASFKLTHDEVILMLAGNLAPRAPRGPRPQPQPRENLSIEVFRHEVHRPEIRARIQRFGDAIAASSGEVVPLGEQLFRELFPEPARKRVLAARRLVISPEGHLWNLPFNALVVGRAAGVPRYLGLQVPVAVAPSLAFFDAARRLPRAVKQPAYPVILAAGDPQFGPPSETPAGAAADNTRTMLWIDGKPPAPLPGTRADAEAVARLYGGKPLLGAAATEAEIRARLPKADVVHLATHGYLSPQWALASGVLLSDAPAPPGKPGATPAPPDPRNDGALQAWEILSQLKLKAELVVLAACETARGETLSGEGLVGLTRALQIAGARSIVTSQWRVRDDATRVLMVRFHEGIRAGLPKDEALRRAMTSVSGRSGWAHPYYWAGFVLSGDPDALRLPTPVKPAPVKMVGKRG